MATDKKSPTIRNPEDLFQRDVKGIVDKIKSTPIINGQIVSSAIGTSATRVSHKLGRPPIGFILVDSSADVRVWRSGLSSAQHIFLVANTPATVSLWIF